MKRIALIWKLLLIPIFCGAQISLDSTAYKAFRVTVYANEQVKSANSEILFYIDNSKITSSAKDQTKFFYFREVPHTEDIGTDQPNIMAKCYDDGGYRCTIVIVYEEDTDTYAIIINYNNVMFFYQCKISEERPWDNEPIDWVKESQKYKYRENPIYTDEEVDAFFLELGVDPKVAREALINDLLMEGFGN